MNQRDDLDQMLSAWLDDPYTPPAPRYLGDVLERTRHTRQRPAWTYPGRWFPMASNISVPTVAGPRRVAWLLLIALLVVAVAAAIAVVGSRFLRSTVPIPLGGAAVLAFGSIGSDSTGSSADDIFTVRADGTDLRRLTNGFSVESNPVWSPDGTRIAYQVLQGGDASVVVMDAGGRRLATLATIPQSHVDCIRGGLAWSPDGTMVVFQSSAPCDGRYDLFIAPADGSSPATKLLDAGTYGTYATWSPDGKRIAFLGKETADPTSLYVVDVPPSGVLSGGLQPRRIGPGSGSMADIFFGPQWSPDGTELAVAAELVAAVSNGFSIVKADGSGQRALTTTGHNPTWSPDGKRLAFHRTVDPSEYFETRPCTVRAWIVDADGSNERRLDPLGDGCGFPPTWSPDGTRLAGSLITSTPADPTVSFHVGIVTVDGSGSPVILPDGGNASWQPVAAPLPAAPSFPGASPTP